MVWLPVGTNEEVAQKVWLYSLHKTLGVALLTIAIARIAWAVANPKPAPLHPEREWETFAAETVHWLLYAGIILAPVTGLVHHFATTGFAPIWWPFAQTVSFIPQDEGLATLFKYLHFAAAVMITASVIAHIAGALKHSFVDKDKTVTRMVCGPDEVISMPIASNHGRGQGFATASIAGLLITVAAGGGYGYATQLAQRPEAVSLTVSIPSAEENEASALANWLVDMEQSTLGVTATQLGSPVTGAFANWQADIRFDPDQLDQSRVSVQIDTGSLTLGTVSGQATGSDFLAASEFPIATFEADTFEKTSETEFVARGELTIRDQTAEFELPFSLIISDDNAQMTSTVELNRMDFGVGAANYGSEDSVGFAVGIDIELNANRAGADTAPGSVLAN